MNTSSEIQFQISPINDDYDPNDDRWLDQVNELVYDLQKEVGDVHQESTAVEGQKGAVAALILALGSAGAIKAAVDMFKTWLDRDQSRELIITVKRNGKTETFKVTGNRMDKEDMRSFMEAALKS